MGTSRKGLIVFYGGSRQGSYAALQLISKPLANAGSDGSRTENGGVPNTSQHQMQTQGMVLCRHRIVQKLRLCIVYLVPTVGVAILQISRVFHVVVTVAIPALMSVVILACAENAGILGREKSARPTKSILYNRTVLLYLTIIVSLSILIVLRILLYTSLSHLLNILISRIFTIIFRTIIIID